MGYSYRILQQNYECNLIKYNVEFYTKPILSFLDFPVVSDEILMPGFSTNYAKCFLLVLQTA